jgi:hypothetical protein
MAGRKTYGRPQAMLWSKLPPTSILNPLKNMIPNNSFEGTTTYWTYSGFSGSAGTITSVTETTPQVGTSVLKATATAAAGRLGIVHAANIIPVEVGSTYTYSIYVKDGTSSEQYISYIEWRDATTVLSATTGTATTVNSSTWTRVSVTGTAPAGATNVRVYTYSSTAPNSIGMYAYFDAALMQKSATVNDYVVPSFMYIPQGYNVGDATSGDNFLIISDHNRKDISFKVDRIEKRERTVNGRMRSYHIADKLTLSTSWDNLPSRAFSNNPLFDDSGKPTVSATQWTVDGGAGGNELLDWYNNNTGSFWVFLAYDKHGNFNDSMEYNHLAEYNQVLEMFVSSFDYSVVKRGTNTYDMWNVSCSLEEV